ncbi:MAG: ATP:cob(I)alamin adenosyltransferase, partial [SAR324 cluster bacterium]|nr:ATP:cob(I)alamin adenosyltransferase [SAR324 cluster bacterium]
SRLGAQAHVARTVCRRAERRILKLADTENLGIAEDQFKQICAFINRLSDYLFAVARFISHQLGEPDILWKKS